MNADYRLLHKPEYEESNVIMMAPQIMKRRCMQFVYVLGMYAGKLAAPADNRSVQGSSCSSDRHIVAPYKVRRYGR